MAERIAEEKLEEIRQAVDIVEVISDYVQLKKQGRNYFGLCPFHGENSPSFSVSTEKQIFHCFGCGAGGNVFTFLMEHEGISFVEAAAKVADKANIKVDIELSGSGKEKQIPKDQQLMIEAHELLKKFYHHLLVNTKEGQHALEYLLQRGFSKESIERFQIGYSLDSWEFVTKLLTKRGYDHEIMEKAGLMIRREKDNTYFDRFRNRIMFPIQDRNGNTIAFSGRSLGSDEPKYLNSPETPIFNKSKTLYNFHQARPAIKKLGHLVLFEGFADVIAAERAGIENGVATMGTSLTEPHIALIRQNAQTVTVCFDSDHAGVEAAFKAGSMLSKTSCNLKIAMLPDGLDPDDYIKKHGGEKFKNEIMGYSLTWMAFKLVYLRRGKNLQSEGDRLRYIEEVLKEISLIKSAVEKDHYLRQLSSEFTISLEALKQQENELERQNQPVKAGRQDKRPALPPLKRETDLKPAYYNAERRLISHMLKSRDLTYKVQELLQGNPFNTDEHQAIITYLFGYYEANMDPDPSAFLTYIKDPLIRRAVVNIEMMTINDEMSDQELNDYIKQVLNYPKMLKIREKTSEQQEAERQKDYAKAAMLATEIIQLRKMIKT